MFGWVARLLLIIASSITSWFVGHDALKFQIIQMIVAVILLTLIVTVIAFWPMIKARVKQIRARRKKS